MLNTPWSLRRPQLRMPSCPALASLALALASAPLQADITYTLQFNPADSGNNQQVANSVAVAAAFYNQYGSFNKHWNVYSNSGIPTAEANYSGYMGYGGIRNERVVFHEAAHTFGMGTYGNYGTLISGGVWKGKYGNQAQFDTYNTYGDGLHGDGHAVWPSGFNYDNEDGTVERHWHTRIMAGLRADLGILSYTREARNDAVVVGETAEFRVESPMATSYQWSRNGVNLTNGGDISGANTARLLIANAEAADAGTYRCAVTGANETLNNRTRQLWVHPSPQLGQWNFNGNANDGLNTNHGTAFGSPAYVAGKIGQAVDLDGTDDYIDLPDPMGRTSDTTIATWVNWDGGGDWQRIFDFGTGTNQNFFLTPKAGGGSMRLSIKDVLNGKNQEYQVNTTTLPVAQWVHLAAVIKGNYMTLYVNGKPVGSVFNLDAAPAQFPATNNYIGKSQYNDPLFNGRVDDFRLYGKALSGSEIWALWGESANQAPVFSPQAITLPAANTLGAYTGQSLATYATDADSNPLTFSKLNGPAWLTVAANGTLSGQPGPNDGGTNTFIVRVTDSVGATSDAMVTIPVTALLASPVTSSTTTPAIDADDVSFIATNITELNSINGTSNPPDNDESTFLAETRNSKGQTFTTKSNPLGYFLQSFSFQHVKWPSDTPPGTAYDVQPGDQWEFQVGSISGTTKTPMIRYVATYDGTAITSSGDTGTGRWFTFNLSNLGLQLAPDTTYYFEVAPLSGEPFFELSSLRTASYAGGTAFRGNTPGALGTAVNPLTGDYVFHANLEAKSTVLPSSTVAYWNFEEGVTNNYVPYVRTTSNQYEGSILDQSGKANNLSVWTGNWAWYRSAVPASTTPQTGAANTLSMQNAGSFPAVSTLGTSLTTWSPEQWTIEATIRPDDATNGYQTFIGRDSVGAYTGDLSLAALYFQLTPTGALQISFTDAAGNNWRVTSAANAIQDTKWHAVAATSDGDTLKLYLKNITNGDANYTLIGTTDISSSTNPALTTGLGDGGDWDAGVFTIGRGLYNGGHTDRYFGHIDDIRFSNAALAPASLLYSQPLPTFANWINTYPAVGSQTGFNDDPDGDGLVNGIENYLGTNPGTPSQGLRNLATTTNTITFQHSRNTSPSTDVTGTYRWSSDLQNWNASGATQGGTTVTFAASPNTPVAGTTTVTATITGTTPAKLFVELQATTP